MSRRTKLSGKQLFLDIGVPQNFLKPIPAYIEHGFHPGQTPGKYHFWIVTKLNFRYRLFLRENQSKTDRNFRKILLHLTPNKILVSTSEIILFLWAMTQVSFEKPYNVTIFAIDLKHRHTHAHTQTKISSKKSTKKSRK